MDEIIILAKIKFDLRDPDEVYFARHELSAILGINVEPIRTIPAIFKRHPFNKLNDDIIHIITRNLYLGEIQGYMAKVKSVDTKKLIFKPSFFKEIYLFIETYQDVGNVKQRLALNNENLYQLFITPLENSKRIVVIRLLPIQTLFEYITDVKKLPYIAITPKSARNWKDYFYEKEMGIEKGLDELLEHIKSNHFRAPHFGLGKKHIGDFVDWAYTDLRKPFMHYLHKYKGKGDPRISRALINLLNVNRGDTILDPFAGSGAFLADAPTMGLNAIGIELLEIGKLISEVKCDLNYNLEDLRKEMIELFLNIENKNHDLFGLNVDDEIKKIRTNLNQYMTDDRSFKNILPHLPNIVHIKLKIDRIQDEKIRKFFLVLLSQKIVEFSEKKRSNNFVKSFQSYVEDRYLTLYATLKLAEKLNISINDGEVRIIKSDSTLMDFIESDSIDGILTSPPYFDALDYIGNNKISIIILGFYEDLKLGSTMDYYSKFERYELDLPESALSLINLLKRSQRSKKAKIVENYLKMMKMSFKECYRVLKQQKLYVMVVSKYHTWIINGEERRVETSKILVDLGISEGFKLVKTVQHGLSKADKGKINVEDILIFQK